MPITHYIFFTNQINIFTSRVYYDKMLEMAYLPNVRKDMVIIMMKTRAEFKAEAKQSLQGKYWYSVGVTLLFTVLSAIQVSIVTLLASNNAQAVSSIVNLLLTFFFQIPISVGLIRYFIKLAKGGDAQVGDMFHVFKNGYGNVILTEIKQAVFIMLWSMLFVVPGIIKMYQYFMIDYMLAENPSMNNKRAFAITKAAMAGHKWEAFVLGLSFIGWVLLAGLTAGIGTFFLMPYMRTTFSKYYLALKETAIEKGIASAEDFGETIIIEN